jgi:hypothetical protein
MAMYEVNNNWFKVALIEGNLRCKKCFEDVAWVCEF